MNLTKSEVARLGRKAQQPTRDEGELVAIRVTGRLVNPLNERIGPYFAGKQARYKRQWKERIALALLEAGARMIPFFDGRPVGIALPTASIPSGTPKRVHFHAIVPKKFDSQDGLRAAMKAFPDAMKECGVVNDDRDSAGHEWVYTQEASRTKPAGVEIRVRVR